MVGVTRAGHDGVRWPRAAVLLLIPLAGCPKSTPAPAADTPAAAPAAAAPQHVEIAKVWGTAKRNWLVPHPTEIQGALKSLGISADLAALATPTTPDFGPMDGPRVALNTGVVAAELILTLDTGTNAQTAAQLKTLARGLQELGAPPAQLKRVEQFTARVSGGTLSKDALTGELDELQAGLLDKVDQYSSEDALVGVQAGAWLRAVNVISQALIKSGKAAEGGQIFRQPMVVDYFLKYFKANQEKAEGSKAFEGVLPIMEELRAVAAKPELNEADIQKVATTTSNILKRL